MQALPAKANQGTPNFVPGQWNKFSTRNSASNRLVWSDTGHGGNFTTPLPSMSQLRNDSINWSNYGGGISVTHDYRDKEVLALSLQTGSEYGIPLEAWIDDITVELTTGDSLIINLER